MHWLLIAVLAFDLGAVKSEPNLERRSDRALDNANTALDAARDAYSAADLDKTQSALKEAGAVPAFSNAAKVIVSGKLTRKVALAGIAVSKGARAAIEAAGGSTDAPVPQPKPKPEPKWVAAPQPEAQAKPGKDEAKAKAKADKSEARAKGEAEKAEARPDAKPEGKKGKKGE